MKVKCDKCQQEYEVQRVKQPVSMPDSIRHEKVGNRSRMSWWHHKMPADLRWLAVVAIVFLSFVARQWLPSLGTIGAFETLILSHGTAWQGAAWAMVVWTVWLVLVLRIVNTLARRRVVEVDAMFLRAWSEPIATASLEIPVRQIRQLYVSREGELRCQTGSRSHVILGKGLPADLRYVEQQVEDRLNIEDTEIEGEWFPRGSAELDVKACPHCQAAVPVRQVQEVLDAIPTPPGVSVDSASGQLQLSWSWRGPELVFLTLWLTIWDGVCSVFVLGGLATAMRGDLTGLCVFLIPHVWIGFIMTWYYIACLLNRTNVVANRDQFSISCGPIPWMGFAKTFWKSEVDQLYVVQHSGKSTTYSLEARMKNGNTVRVLGNEQPARLRFVEQQLERHLEIEDRRMSGEFNPRD